MSDRPPSIESIRKKISEILIRDRFSLRRKLNQAQKLAPEKRNSRTEAISNAIEDSLEIVQQRRQQIPEIQFPLDLPISQRREELVELIKQNQVIIVCGETGSGKSTQLPKICLEAGQGVFGKIGHTQPRRIAARSVASRIAEELNVAVGKQVGYKIRFSDKTTKLSNIKLMTDGILLAETQTDRYLEEYDTIILDEAHERSLNIDFLMGYLKNTLAKRPDLKLIVTSATIDAIRFRDHFSNATHPAPVITVEGRTFPVETYYRPVESVSGTEGDLFEAIQQSVSELLDRDPGDILIFLPTEKDIRTATKKLRGANELNSTSRSIEILPLYARLGVDNQNKIFKPQKSLRIVLATNVAESSITVPRIKYVIDTGTARISRYASRSKIQRLPVEKISQASAKQRAGRCGRLGPGVCIRLFSEEDFDSRDPFTTPEIRRTNLASVILQSKSMHMGDVESIDFLDPPRPEAIRDGYKTLFEIGATNTHRKLTSIGNRIQNFPCDPRISRMILAANDEGVLADVLIIAAALETQDVRDRPAEKQKQADAAHEQFKDSDSDFLVLLKIWDFFHQQKKVLSNNQLKKVMQQNFLSFTRMREWLEVFRQLRELCLQQKIKIGSRRNDYDRIHRSLLAGLLSGIAIRGEKHIYQGAGGMSFNLWPGSGLSDQNPKWILGSELVETSKRFIRNVARIQPAWIEPLGKHLVTRSHSDPHWHVKSEQVMAFEKVSLFGLVIVPRRAVAFRNIEPHTCRTLFIEEGLILEQMNRPFVFLENNREIISQAESLATKTRRRDLIVETATIFRFYDDRLPDHVIDGASLFKWLKESRENEDRLCLTTKDLLESDPENNGGLFPEDLHSNKLKLDLSYVFEPGNDDDGVTTRIPAVALSQIQESQMEWLIPGLVEQKIASLIRSLPKSKRRMLVPAPDKAKAVSRKITFGQGDFLNIVATALSEMTEEPVNPEDFNLTKLEPHLRMNIAVTGEDGEIVDQGRDLLELQQKYCDQQSKELRDLQNPQWHADGLSNWDFGTISKSIQISHGDIEIPAFPAIIDKGDSISLRLVPSSSMAEKESKFGAMRLAVIRHKKQLKGQIRWLPDVDRYTLAAAQIGGVEKFRSGLIDLIAKRSFIDGFPNHPQSELEFNQRFTNSTESISMATQEIATLLPNFFDHHQKLVKRISDTSAETYGQVLSSIKSQLSRLFQDQFWVSTPWLWLQRFPVYFESASHRLQKLNRSSLGQQLEKQKLLDRFHEIHKDLAKRHQAQGIHCDDLVEFRWMIEELSVSIFSQQLGTRLPVSEKRLEKQLAKIS